MEFAMQYALRATVSHLQCSDLASGKVVREHRRKCVQDWITFQKYSGIKDFSSVLSPTFSEGRVTTQHFIALEQASQTYVYSKIHVLR